VLEVNANNIKNKEKRMDIKAKQKTEKRVVKRELRKKRQKEDEELGDKAPDRAKQQKTLDNTREYDETVVDPEDDELAGATEIDEWSKYFKGDVKPKILLTTNYRPTKRMYDFIRDLLRVFPNSFYYSRRNYEIKKIVEYGNERGFTDLLFLNEDKKIFNAMTHVHLPEGPTAHYKLTNVKLSSEIEGHGTMQSHKPEVILNNFNTQLGQRVGRMLGSLFHQEPNFKGRRVCTFHNQRDYLFFRHHRYIFDSVEKARLQELGPQFTLKLKWLQHGTFDTKFGQYEWIHKKEMGTSRRRFFL
jgi:ribosome production factor 1